MNKNDTQNYSFFATAPKGVELLLEAELKAFGAQNLGLKLAGVSFTGDLRVAYRACLWSRLANRILLQLASFKAATPDALYQGVQGIDWSQHLGKEQTLAVHFTTSHSQINHSLFGAQKVKDAIVDQIRTKCGERPSVDRQTPDVSIFVYLRDDVATIYLDLAGMSLHKRGYRLSAGEAPLKENLAAALLLRAKWLDIAKAGGSFLDPMCGSGTLLIEAAMMAADIAPGLNRHYFGFLGWKQHKPEIFAELLAEAKARRDAGMKQLPRIVGYDHDASAIKTAFENIAASTLTGKIHVEKRALSEFAPQQKDVPGLVMTNPPYGERLGELDDLKPLYRTLGDRLKSAFVGWQAAVFTGNPSLGKVMGLRAKHYYALFNGAIPCQLLLFTVDPSFFVDRSKSSENERLILRAKKIVAKHASPSLAMLVNRLQKNCKHYRKKARKLALKSIRVYDKDLPEYQFAIDLVNDDEVHVFEYRPSRNAPIDKVTQHRNEFLSVLEEIFAVSPAKIFFHEKE